jgi:hypothetical protein
MPVRCRENSSIHTNPTNLLIVMVRVPLAQVPQCPKKRAGCDDYDALPPVVTRPYLYTSSEPQSSEVPRAPTGAQRRNESVSIL